MRALTWQGTHDVRVDTVPDPTIQEPTDAIIRVTTTGLCGSDLHLYEVLGAFIDPGDILGHEPMGIVEAVGADVTHIAPGDRVVVPFNISCGQCEMCGTGFQSQCETTQVREYDTGASLLGYTKLYGQVPGGQAELLRVPQAHYGPIKVPEGPPDDRFVLLSDVLPTAYQAVQYADVPEGGTLLVLGLGPIGEMACRIAQHLGIDQVIGVDLVPERLARSRRTACRRSTSSRWATTSPTRSASSPAAVARTASSTRSAWRPTAHRSAVSRTACRRCCPTRSPQPVIQKAAIDRLSALHAAIDLCRRGGTVSISGVYGGAIDPMPMIQMFDKQLTFRMGQANVRRWVDDLMPMVTDDADPLGLESFATHHCPSRRRRRPTRCSRRRRTAPSRCCSSRELVS